VQAIVTTKLLIIDCLRFRLDFTATHAEPPQWQSCSRNRAADTIKAPLLRDFV